MNGVVLLLIPGRFDVVSVNCSTLSESHRIRLQSIKQTSFQVYYRSVKVRSRPGQVKVMEAEFNQNRSNNVTSGLLPGCQAKVKTRSSRGHGGGVKSKKIK